MAVATLGSQETALRTRDALTKLMVKVIDEQRPDPRWAVVQSITPELNKASVIFQGEFAPIQVKMGAIRPRNIGQYVRVGGPPGDRWIIDLIGSALVGSADPAGTGQTIPNVNAFTVTNFADSLIANWTPVDSTDSTELQLSTDAAFTNPIGFTTTGAQFTFTGLTDNTDYWVRVRVKTASNAFSEWSASIQSQTVPLVTQVRGDGVAPADSPDVVCRPGIGFIIAEWPPQPNQDAVTYEVYADYASGFQPSAANKLGETSSTFYTVNTLTDGTRLNYANPVFVRVIARDSDGAAPVGAQGFATPDQVNTGDVGTAVLSSEVSDGLAPTLSPNAPTVTPGLGLVHVTWDVITDTNKDAIEYEVHCWDQPSFLPTGNSLVGVTSGGFFFARRHPVGLVGAFGDTFTYERSYYFRVWAKDRDGYAPTPSPSSTVVTPLKVGSGDLYDNSVSAAAIQNLAVGTAHIADAAIASAKIQDGSIINAKIANASISSAKIQNLAVGEAQIGNAVISSVKVQDGAIVRAKIGNAAVGTAEIGTAVITDAHILSLNADKITAGTITGNLIRGGTITGTTINGVNINGGTITGSTFKTSPSGNRLEIYDNGLSSVIEMWSGSPDEWLPGTIRQGEFFSTTPWGSLTIQAPFYDTNRANLPAYLRLAQSTDGQTRLDTSQIKTHGGTGPSNMGFSLQSLVTGSQEHGFYPNGTGEMGMAINRQRSAIHGLFSHIWWYGNNSAQFVLSGADSNAYVVQNGTTTWASHIGVSDERMKVRVRDTERSALDIVKALRPIDYEFDPTFKLDPGTRLGFSAQEVEAVYPQGVKLVQNQEGHPLPEMYHLDPDSMAVLALAAVHELAQTVEDLQSN